LAKLPKHPSCGLIPSDYGVVWKDVFPFYVFLRISPFELNGEANYAHMLLEVNLDLSFHIRERPQGRQLSPAVAKGVCG